MENAEPSRLKNCDFHSCQIPHLNDAYAKYNINSFNVNINGNVYEKINENVHKKLFPEQQ